MRILGIDPGSLRTGYGVINTEQKHLEVVDYGVVAPPAGAVLYQRLTYIASQMAEIAIAHKPDAIAIENVFAGRSPRAALVLGQARGAALAGVGSLGVPVFEVAPTRVKSLVAGSGRAPKAQVKRCVKDLLGIKGRLPVDASDALAVGLSLAFHIPEPGATVPKLRVRRVSARDAWSEELRHLARKNRGRS